MQLHRTGDSTFARTPRGLRRRGWGSLHSGGPVPTPVPPQVGQAGHTAAEEVYGGNLVVADLRTLLMLVNEARYRALERLFGLPRNQANILTLVGCAGGSRGAPRRRRYRSLRS